MDIDLKKIRLEARNLEPLVRIGKNGLTENIINEVAKLLKKKKVVKVKFLHAFLEENERKNAGQKLAERTNSILVEQVGGVVVLMRK